MTETARPEGDRAPPLRMRKPISPTTHGVIDYATVAAVATVPEVLDFPPAAKWFCRSLAADYLTVSLLTDYPPAVKRVIPFKVHGAIEGVIGAVLPVLPWALGFARHKPARNFTIGLAALTVVVASLTDWSAHSTTRRGHKRGTRTASVSRVRTTLPQATARHGRVRDSQELVAPTR